MFPGGNLDSWWEAINRICGLAPYKRGTAPKGELVATYYYVDPSGKLLYQKLRYAPKDFIQRAPKENGGWTHNLANVPKALYRLPELVVCQVALIAEGEKDVDNLRALDWDSIANGKPMPKVGATCNFDGAGKGKWKESYSPFFAGRTVFIFPDNDEAGRIHAADVAAAVAKFASRVSIVELPGLAEHGDISDYLKAHSPSELFALMKAAPVWAPPFVAARPIMTPEDAARITASCSKRAERGFAATSLSRTSKLSLWPHGRCILTSSMLLKSRLICSFRRRKKGAENRLYFGF